MRVSFYGRRKRGQGRAAPGSAGWGRGTPGAGEELVALRIGHRDPSGVDALPDVDAAGAESFQAVGFALDVGDPRSKWIRAVSLKCTSLPIGLRSRRNRVNLETNAATRPLSASTGPTPPGPPPLTPSHSDLKTPATR
jgi:hypothetical protein